MNHKRKRSKNRRSGCLMCKDWKVNGFGKNRKDSMRFSDYKRKQFAGRDIKDDS